MTASSPHARPEPGCWRRLWPFMLVSALIGLVAVGLLDLRLYVITRDAVHSYFH